MVEYCEGHVAVHLDNYIVVIGGRDMNYEPVPTHMIWMYNVYTDQWRKHQIPGQKNAPQALFMASGTAIGTDIYMFGGAESEVNSATNKMWKLTRSPQGCFDWSKIEFQHDIKLPLPRYGHSGWEYKDCLWVFGGCGIHENVLRIPIIAPKYLIDHGDYVHMSNNQLLCYDPSTQIWTNPKCFGTVPSPRACHSTEVIKDKLWLFGGKSWDPNVDLDDFFELDMHSCTWTQIITNWTRPHGRYSSSLSAISASQLVLHGGMSQFHLPCPVPNSYTKLPCLSDTWIMDLPSQTWRQYTSNQDHCRGSHKGSLSANKCIIIIGGYNDEATEQNYTPTFQVILEPKRLHQLAMKTIYNNKDVLPWKCLPSKLVTRLGILNNKETATNEGCQY